METRPVISICAPIPDSERAGALALFWEAFRNKLGPYLRPEHLALAFLDRVFDPAYGIAALDEHGKIVGLAGYKTKDGGLIGGGWDDLKSIYGTFGAAWRSIPLSFFERDVDPSLLLMDGIVVSVEARGQGVGTSLLDAVKTHATSLGLSKVRLDVIDSNARAKALYERQGFRVIKTTNVWPLHRFFGFRSSSEMLFEHAEQTKHPSEV